jgi:hypothetical protein
MGSFSTLPKFISREFKSFLKKNNMDLIQKYGLFRQWEWQVVCGRIFSFTKFFVLFLREVLNIKTVDPVNYGQFVG